VSFTGVGQDLPIEDPNADLAAAEGGYIAPDVEADQDAIAEQVFTSLATRVPGWQAHDGNLETWLTEAWSESASEIRALCADVPASIFQTYGSEVLGIPPQLAVGASGFATFTAVDLQGYTLDVGTTFVIPRSGSDLVAFTTSQTVTIDSGDDTVTEVPFSAVIPGGDANGLAGTAQMADPLAWVADIQVDVPTSGGQDAELPQDYLDRLTVLMRMVALRPVLPQDFAILALQVDGVGRAIAMNLYDPVAHTWTNARTVTLVITDADGQPCSAAIKQQVVDYLEALREVNWVVHVIDPTYTPVAVTFTVTAYQGQNTQTVLDACTANVAAALDPANYRLGETTPAIAGGEVISAPTGATTRRQLVHLHDFVALLDRTLGVDFSEPGQVLLAGAAADFQLPNPYSLPTPGVITGTVLGATT
jgi:hypothetical protein